MALEYTGISSKYSKRIDPDADRKRLALRKAHRGNSNKNHSVNKEKSYVDRKKANILKTEKAKKEKFFYELKRKISAYWRDESDYPSEISEKL